MSSWPSFQEESHKASHARGAVQAVSKLMSIAGSFLVVATAIELRNIIGEYTPTKLYISAGLRLYAAFMQLCIAAFTHNVATKKHPTLSQVSNCIIAQVFLVLLLAGSYVGYQNYVLSTEIGFDFWRWMQVIFESTTILFAPMIVIVCLGIFKQEVVTGGGRQPRDTMTAPLYNSAAHVQNYNSMGV